MWKFSNKSRLPRTELLLFECIYILASNSCVLLEVYYVRFSSCKVFAFWNLSWMSFVIIRSLVCTVKCHPVGFFYVRAAWNVNQQQLQPAANNNQPLKDFFLTHMFVGKIFLLFSLFSESLQHVLALSRWGRTVILFFCDSSKVGPNLAWRELVG